MLDIIRKHVARYPEMEMRDLLKLIYQSEFGGGHMIEDKNKSLEWIKREKSFVQSQKWTGCECVWEDIGGDLCRLYLDVLDQGMSEETLNEMFVLSANARVGTIEGLEQKLELLAEECGGNLEGLGEAIEKWKESGYPAVHHSEAYRNNYFPAYRVVEKKYIEKLNVFITLDQYLKNTTDQVIVAIDGMAGSGKSVLGELLSEVYDCNLFHMDDFFLQPHQRTEKRFAEPGGNVDYERFKVEVLDQLENPEGLWYQKYDCSTQCLKEKEFVPYNKLVIIEGAYSLHPYFGEQADLAFFLEISDEMQQERIRKRNGEQMLQRFTKEWIPMEQKYFREFGIKERAIVV